MTTRRGIAIALQAVGIGLAFGAAGAVSVAFLALMAAAVAIYAAGVLMGLS